MALIGTDEEENLPQSSSDPNAHATYQNNSVNPNGQSSGSGFVGGSGSGSGQGATTSVAAPHNAGGGGYSNLSSYLQANQETGNRTGAAAENVVDQSANAANNAATKFQTDVNNQIAAGSGGLGLKQDVIDNSIGLAQPGAATPQVHYTGPKDVNNLNAQATQEQNDFYNAQALANANIANANGGPAGANALLKSAYGSNPNYTAGQQNLDTFLTGASGALNNATAVGQGISNNYANVLAGINSGIGTAQAQEAATNKAYADAMAKRQASLANAVPVKAPSLPLAAATTPAATAATPKAAASPEVTKTPSTPGKITDPTGSVVKTIVTNPKKAPAVVTQQAGNISKASSAPINYDPAALYRRAGEIPEDTGNAIKKGANSVSNSAGSVGKTLSTIGKNILPAGNPIQSIANVFHGGWAHGGEIPSYKKLRGMLK